MRPLITTTLIALGAIVSFPPSSAAAPSPGWTWPVRGEVITPYRNGGDPYAAGQHRGIDIAAPPGTAVTAAAGGSVTFAGRAGSSGLTVSVRTADGRFDTSYLHLSAVEVRRGDRVGAGQRLGAVGATGNRSAEPPHLHFGVRDAGSRHAYRDPLELLPPLAKPSPSPEPPPVPVEVPLVPFTPVPATVPAELPRTAPPAADAPAADPRTAPEPKSLPLTTPVPLPAALDSPARTPVSARPAGAPAAAGAPGDNRSPGDRARPAGDPAHGLRRRGSPQHSPRVSPPLRSSAAAPREVIQADAPSSPAAPTPTRSAGPARGGGLDVGWLAACVGLIAVALALGRSAGPGEAARRARVTLSSVVRPLAGRR